MNIPKGLSTTAVMGIVLVLVAAGFIIYALTGTDTTEDANTEANVTNSATATTDTVVPPPTYPEGTYGVLLADETTETVELETVIDDPSSFGTAYRLFDAGTLFHAVTANLPTPGEGNSYEGWLVVPGTTTFISTGVMELQDDDTWLLEFTADQEYDTYDLVVITEETVVDATPEIHIIEGQF